MGSRAVFSPTDRLSCNRRARARRLMGATNEAYRLPCWSETDGRAGRLVADSWTGERGTNQPRRAGPSVLACLRRLAREWAPMTGRFEAKHEGNVAMLGKVKVERLRRLGPRPRAAGGAGGRRWQPGRASSQLESQGAGARRRARPLQPPSPAILLYWSLSARWFEWGAGRRQRQARTRPPTGPHAHQRTMSEAVRADAQNAVLEYESTQVKFRILINGRLFEFVNEKDVHAVYEH